MNDTKTVSGAIVHVTDADEAPLVRCLVDITPKQSGTGTPSPDNVRPISGWESVNVYVSPTEDEADGHTTTTSLGRTVYGGTLDVVSGVLTVTHGYLNYNGSENWQADSGRYTIGVSGSYREGYTRIPVTSNEGVFGTGSSVGTIFLSNTQLYYYPPTSVTSLADFKTWLASNNLQVVYPLATPQTHTLTGQEVSAMYGENYIWASSGPVEITYRTNVLGIYNKVYINGRPYFRPNDFQLAREDVYAGEYTSCTGKLIADKIGWRYSDLPMKWDILPDEDLVYLTTLTGAFDLIFRDSDGQHTETVIRRAFTNTPTRTTGPEGTKIWTGVEMEVSFLNTHPINE